jgi:hypothetical protein
MEGDRIAMSQRERDRLKFMSAVLDGKRTQKEAARLMNLSERQVRRIQRRLEGEGDAGIIHRLRGRPSNSRIPTARRQKAIEHYRMDMEGFGATFAAEKLLDRGLKVSVSTLRGWLMAEGLWKRKRQGAKHRSRRERRECRGELVQADGSHHDWLQGRGPKMALLVMIDDATSEVMARFYPAETTEAYMDLLGRYIRERGRMAALYVDGHSVFRSEDRHPDDPQPILTQVGRALAELGVELIQAGSPQAKGRVERFNGTAQDRLVKELGYRNVTTMEKANRILQEVFLPWFEKECTVDPQSPNDAHRPVDKTMDLEALLSIQEGRSVANDYTIRFQNRIYQLQPPAWPGLRGGQVTVEKRLDGSLKLRFKGRYLDYKIIQAGALPPHPRSLAHGRTPSQVRTKEGSAAITTEPCDVRPACGRSGRTPAEPYLPQGSQSIAPKRPYRPAPDHPWRMYPATTTGHF